MHIVKIYKNNNIQFKVVTSAFRVFQKSFIAISMKMYQILFIHMKPARESMVFINVSFALLLFFFFFFFFFFWLANKIFFKFFFFFFFFFLFFFFFFCFLLQNLFKSLFFFVFLFFCSGVFFAKQREIHVAFQPTILSIQY